MARTTRQYKDTLFTMLFGNEKHKDWMLQLYNALNGSSYTNSDDLEITTIENNVYMGMKNDTSFLFESVMNFWEHQSSFNPNMPVRILTYAGQVYDKYMVQHNIDRYSSKLNKLPLPKIVVFYNGERKQPEEQILNLRDAFDSKLDKDSADISVRVRMININNGHSQSLLDACQPLKEYSWFVQDVRNNIKDIGEVSTLEEKRQRLNEAIDKAIDDMPNDYIIKPFLLANRSEVKVSYYTWTEYDQKLHLESEKKISYEQGREDERHNHQSELKLMNNQINQMNSSLKQKDIELAQKESELDQKDQLIQELLDQLEKK